MKDEELKFDRTCHVLYSKSCKTQIQDKVSLHYPEEQRKKNLDTGPATVRRFSERLADRSWWKKEFSQWNWRDL